MSSGKLLAAAVDLSVLLCWNQMSAFMFSWLIGVHARTYQDTLPVIVLLYIDIELLNESL